jgi:hypothetical protein
MQDLTSVPPKPTDQGPPTASPWRCPRRPTRARTVRQPGPGQFLVVHLGSVGARMVGVLYQRTQCRLALQVLHPKNAAPCQV